MRRRIQAWLLLLAVAAVMLLTWCAAAHVVTHRFCCRSCPVCLFFEQTEPALLCLALLLAATLLLRCARGCRAEASHVPVFLSLYAQAVRLND